jgi:X-X-X-Leu-X-X-Gly heptad repeat protein
MAEAEASWASADGLARLVDGLAQLADVMDTAARAEARTAANLAAAYAGRLYARVRDTLERDAQVPEPELEHYFKVVLAFDQVREALPPAAAELKIGVVKALIERYYEGHPVEKKRAALEQLAALERGK